MSPAAWEWAGWIAVGAVSFAVALWTNWPSDPKPQPEPVHIPKQRGPQQ